MNIDNGPQKIGDIINLPKTKKPPAYQWQDFALSIIKDLSIPNEKKSSVFKVCKQYSRPYVQKCLNDTKELCKTGEKWKYFFKIVNGSK